LATAINEDGLLEDGVFDKQGGLKSIKVPWMEKTGAEKVKGQTTVKGDLNISPNKLTIDVNSHNRADVIKRKIQDGRDSELFSKRQLFNQQRK